MSRLIAFVYGLFSYAVFFVTFLYAIGFVSDLVVPKTIDDGPMTTTSAALVINMLLMSLFAIQHSMMARRPFKAMVDAVRAQTSRTQYLCAIRKLGVDPAVLAMAAVAECGLAH
jgi:protein-S-isoprenylcysteine O-methyltransferase Ste14